MSLLVPLLLQGSEWLVAGAVIYLLIPAVVLYLLYNHFKNVIRRIVREELQRSKDETNPKSEGNG